MFIRSVVLIKCENKLYDNTGYITLCMRDYFS